MYLCFVWLYLKINSFFHDFIMFNLRETKRKAWVTIFPSWNYDMEASIFYNCFHQWITYVVSHWFHFIILGNPWICYNIREKLVQNRSSVFVILYNVAILYHPLQLSFIIKACPHPNVSIITQGFLTEITKKKLCSTLSQKCNTQIPLLNINYLFSSVLHLRKTPF